jgi:hypothetical protein
VADEAAAASNPGWGELTEVAQGLLAAADLELAVDPLDVAVHGASADREPLADFLVNQTLAAELEQLDLAGRQPVFRVRGAAAAEFIDEKPRDGRAFNLPVPLLSRSMSVGQGGVGAAGSVAGGVTSALSFVAGAAGGAAPSSKNRRKTGSSLIEAKSSLVAHASTKAAPNLRDACVRTSTVSSGLS